VPTFEPPTDRFLTWDDGTGDGIMSYLQAGDVGRNVYKLTDGTYTEDEPFDNTIVAKVYHGGHVHELTTQEVADLTTAGYGAYITA